MLTPTIVFSVLLAAVSAAPASQCIIPEQIKQKEGKCFSVDFYKYPLKSDIAWSPGFLDGGYAELEHQGHVDNVCKVNYEVRPVHDDETPGKIHNYDTSISNHLIRYTANFKPIHTGYHKITLAADDFGAVSFRRKTCSGEGKVSANVPFEVKAINDLKAPKSLNKNKAAKYFHFEKEDNYDVEIIAGNRHGPGGLQVSMNDPLGKYTADIGNLVDQDMFTETSCPAQE